MVSNFLLFPNGCCETSSEDVKCKTDVSKLSNGRFFFCLDEVRAIISVVGISLLRTTTQAVQEEKE